VDDALQGADEEADHEEQVHDDVVVVPEGEVPLLKPDRVNTMCGLYCASLFSRDPLMRLFLCESDKDDLKFTVYASYIILFILCFNLVRQS
jgi:hypothetical protein